MLLRLILLLRKVSPLTIVEIVENTATLEAVHENRVIGQYLLFVGVEPGERYRARFEWSRAEWLNKARDETVLSVGHTEQQPTYIVWRFFLGEGEYLEYVKEPIP
ncbi:uncharacterized protein LOC141599372 isoform X2 [Silene latifolia]|uniref:uncharacterized protein LOC141599372 isoform X2 n=1 Tax=Silene latifolia TaxID=37657 RepID=UPI003D77A4B5